MKCDECDFQTLREETLENHKKRVHSQKKKDKEKETVPHKCQWCDFTNKKKWFVVRHEKTCHGRLRANPENNHFIYKEDLAGLYSGCNATSIG